MPEEKPGSQPGFATRLVQMGRPGIHEKAFVNPPLVRGSTVLQPSVAERLASSRQRYAQALTYGVNGTPTHFALEDMVAEIEGGTRCQIVSSGLAACTIPLLAYLKSGEHCLVPDSVYGPTRHFCEIVLRDLGITATFYPPTMPADELAALFRPETRVLFTESPGSHTFEMQDIRALADLAHARGAKVLMDNTWGIHFFQPFRHGVDVSIQALTKYLGGHSDILLGAIVTNSDADWQCVRGTAGAFGQYASPDDCWLALRGARTLSVRLRHQMESGLTVASWLAARSEVLRVLHPALPGDPGHALWKRDFTGAPSLFGVIFQPRYTMDDVVRFIDALSLFGIGASWGGFESLILPTNITIKRSHGPALPGPTARIHVGLEDPADLIADLERNLTLLEQT